MTLSFLDSTYNYQPRNLKKTAYQSIKSSTGIYHLSEAEIEKIQSIIREIINQFNIVNYSELEEKTFLKMANIYSQELPRELRKFLNDFKLNEQNSLCLIKGFPVKEILLPPTPNIKNNSQRLNNKYLLFLLINFLLIGTSLGELFRWNSHVDKKIIHDIIPIKGKEKEQLSSGSEKSLLWHTEDAFHPCRADYLGLMCLRNPDQVATTFSDINIIMNLETQQRQVLFEPRFYIYPDKAHTQKDEFFSNQLKVPVLFGNPESPYICLDPLFMYPSSDDCEAYSVLKILIDLINKNLQEIILQPGDLCFIDNYRAVHGRKKFHATYNGSDRWLKRIFITRDLRKSRRYRTSNLSRIVF